MLGRSILAFLVYVFGLAALLIWSIFGFLTGAPRDDWALMIVLPLAWAFSYWSMLGSPLMIIRVRGLQRTMEGIALELQAGRDPSPENLLELEEVGTKLAARENRLPEFIVRPFIRKILNRLFKDGALKRIIEREKEREREKEAG